MILEKNWCILTKLKINNDKGAEFIWNQNMS